MGNSEKPPPHTICGSFVEQAKRVSLGRAAFLSDPDKVPPGKPRRDFAGFQPLEANFTPTPNAFFDKVMGHYPLRVVSVVAILIRATSGWRDSVTGEKRVEAELALSDFVRPELSLNSARQGIREAIAAGFVVETAAPTNRDGTRYALRWADDGALRTAVERQRRANGDARELSGALFSCVSGDPTSGPPISGPPRFGGPKSAPPIYKETFSGKETVSSNVLEKPLNVTQTDIDRLLTRGGTFNGEDRDMYNNLVIGPVREIISLTADGKSASRFVQLREICLRTETLAAWSAALTGLRSRCATPTARKVGKPGAWFNVACVKELEKRGVIVPSRADEGERDEVRGMIAESLGMGE